MAKPTPEPKPKAKADPSVKEAPVPKPSRIARGQPAAKLWHVRSM